GLFEASGGFVTISQTTPPKPITVKLSAFTTQDEEGTNGSGDGGVAGAGFFDGLVDGNGVAVDGADDLGYIQSVTLRNADGTIVTVPIGGGGSFIFENISTNVTMGGYSVTFAQTDDLEDGAGGELNQTVTVTGPLATIDYTLADGTTHNRLVVENAGTGNSTFDIGGIGLPNQVVLPQEVGSAFVFEDDAPTIGVAQQKTVDEDALTGQSTGIDNGPGDVGAGVLATASGSLAGMFNAGNDGLKSFGMSDAQADINLITAFDSTSNPDVAVSPLKSKGGTVTYDVDGNTLWGFVDAGASPLVYDAGVDRAVFKLELTDDPVDVDTDLDGYLFTLLDQLDHPTFDTDPTHNDTENEILLNLGSVLKITDMDDDFVTGEAGSLQITVDDDTPIRTGVVGGGTVDEDGVLEGAANNGPGDGIAGGPAGGSDVNGEAVTATGNVSTMFQSGADEDLTYTLTNTGLPALTSGGVTVTYLVTTAAGVDTLTASAGAGNTVFTLALTKATGAYTFTLVDQLDHAAGLAENDLSLSLGAAISATDYDGDSVAALAADFVIVVDDDTPIRTGVVGGGTVDEDGVLE
uniref:T1SS-143 repeat domain-containing protein n=1 Tax=Aeromicrobium sp. TaxID=1871063 RepID=UPI002FCB0803